MTPGAIKMYWDSQLRRWPCRLFSSQTRETGAVLWRIEVLDGPNKGRKPLISDGSLCVPKPDDIERYPEYFTPQKPA